VIRVLLNAALLTLACLVLYIPSRVLPERLLEVLQTEHATNERIWGPTAAARILARLDGLRQVDADLGDPLASPAPAPPGVLDGLLPMNRVGARFFETPYFRSVHALLVLAVYRIIALAELVPLLSVFALVVVIDGFVVRIVRAREFVPHSAEIYASSIAGGIALASTEVATWLLPWPLHPMVATVCLLLMLLLLSRALANYHYIR
jgi:hypothetical protein